MNSCMKTGYGIGREFHDRVLEGGSRSKYSLLQILLSTLICFCSLNEMASTSKTKKTKGSLARFLETLWAMVDDEDEIEKCSKYISWNEVS